MIAPTCKELFNEELKLVTESVVSQWRHGTVQQAVYYRESDNTYWQAEYRVTPDGETNELREGYANIKQVKPVEKVVTVYEYCNDKKIEVPDF